MAKLAFTVTTINVPTFIEDYVKADDHSHDVEFIVIGDVKTPEVENIKLEQRIKSAGYPFEYMSPQYQAEWLALNYPKLEKHIPWNSGTRRNLGYLRALEGNAKVVLSMDDDNLVGNKYFFESHSIVGEEHEFETVRPDNGWFNPCSLLEFNTFCKVYIRGYPYYKRSVDDQTERARLTGLFESGKIAINMGLWREKPDVDAVTNLMLPGLAVVNGSFPESNTVMLSKDTRMPINTQNTAIMREAIPAFFCLPNTGRYDDIWAGIMVEKVISHMGDRVTVGKPLTIHQRNSHNFIRDLEAEMRGMKESEELYQRIDSAHLTSNNYAEAYMQLAAVMDSDMAVPMLEWAEATDQLV